MKIVILDGYTANPGDLSWEGFEQLGELKVYDRTPVDKIVERIGDAEAVYTNKAPITAQTIDACPNLKYIGVLATGYNIVDVQAAKDRGIPVTNVPGYSTEAVAQLAIALLLEICHHVGEHSAAVRRGDWTNCKDFAFWNYRLIELKGKTMGIMGYGQTGQATGRIARALGMKVIAYNAHSRPEGWVPLDVLFAQSDVISLHCPLTPETRRLIRKENIDKMKDGVIIINTSRGPVADEQDLADALNTGKVYAAGVDVVSEEPIRADNPLLKAKNCFITPHFAWAPLEARVRLIEIAVRNLKAFLDGQVENRVN